VSYGWTIGSQWKAPPGFGEESPMPGLEKQYEDLKAGQAIPTEATEEPDSPRSSRLPSDAEEFAAAEEAAAKPAADKDDVLEALKAQLAAQAEDPAVDTDAGRTFADAPPRAAVIEVEDITEAAPSPAEAPASAESKVEDLEREDNDVEDLLAAEDLAEDAPAAATPGAAEGDAGKKRKKGKKEKGKKRKTDPKMTAADDLLDEEDLEDDAACD
jgi:hypothetical protein